jgi:hypothetical protein
MRLKELPACRRGFTAQNERSRLTVSPTVAVPGAIMASMRLGNQSNVVDVIDDAIKSRVKIESGACFDQAFKAPVSR